VFLAVGVFGWAIRFDFLNYDDPIYVSANARVRTGLSVENVLYAFRPTIGLWHPLTWISYLIDSSCFGKAPWGFHLTNLLLHTGNTLLVYWVFLFMTRKHGSSLILALLFGLHPVQVEPVAWISSRKDLLCGLFWLLTLAAYAAYVRKGSFWFYWIAFIMFLCSAMSKATAMTLPFSLLVLDFWPLGRLDKSPLRAALRRCLIEKIPFFLVAVGIVLMSVYAARTGGSLRTTEELPLLTRLSNVPVYYLRYFIAAIFPVSLSPHYPLRSEVEPFWRVASGSVVLIALVILAFRLRRCAPFVSAGVVWFVITLAPVSGLVQVGGQSIAMRYLYMPILGILFAVVWSVASLARRFSKNNVIGVAAAMSIAVVFGILSFLYLQHWRDTESVFRRVVNVQPEDDLGHATLGAELFERGEIGSAFDHLNTALRLNPNQPTAHVGIGRYYVAVGRRDEAEQAFRRAIALDPENYIALTNLGALLAESGRLQEAEKAYVAAIKLNDTYEDAWNNLGNVYTAQQRFDRALECYKQALEINPNHAGALSNVGALYLFMQRPAEALPYLEAALRLDPTDTSARLNLAVGLEQLQRLEEAVEQLKIILRDQPSLENAKRFLRDLEHRLQQGEKR